MDAPNKVLQFGKHSGKTYDEIRRSDISYCNWVLKQQDTRGSMKDLQDWLKGMAKKVTCEACNGSGFGHSM